jgi:hypothetical protein
VSLADKPYLTVGRLRRRCHVPHRGKQVTLARVDIVALSGAHLLRQREKCVLICIVAHSPGFFFFFVVLLLLLEARGLSTARRGPASRFEGCVRVCAAASASERCACVSLHVPV